jgi:glutamate racemase
MKIGIFDSGIGGLTVFKEIEKRLPENDYVYLGDTARLPYGIKSKKTIKNYSLKNTDFLVGKGCEIIIVACNSASSYSIPILKKRYKIPIFNVIESGVNAISNSCTKVGIIGTPSTIESESYLKLLKKNKNLKKIISEPCPIFVPIIEQGLYKKKSIHFLIEENLNKFQRDQVQELILGCTHYPLIKPIIKKFLPKVTLVDSSVEVANSIESFLDKKEKIGSKVNFKREIFFTDKSKYFEEVLKAMFKNLNYKVKLVDIR